MHEFNAARLAPVMTAQLHHSSTLLPFMWNLEVWKHSKMHLICRTTGDRWTMALSEARTDVSKERHVAHAVDDRDGTLHTGWLVGAISRVPLLER
jgi:hypothetical protein